MKRQSFCTTNLTKMKPKPLFLDLCQSKKRKKGYNLEVLTGRRRGFDRETSSFRQEDMFFRQEDMKTDYFRQEDRKTCSFDRKTSSFC